MSFRTALWSLVLTVCLLPLLAAAQATPGKGPKQEPKESPAAKLLARIQADAALTGVRTKEEYEAKVKQQTPKVLAGLAEMEKRYPKAEELHMARLAGLMAASRLARIKNDPLTAAQAEGIAKTVLASKAPLEMRLYADFMLTVFQLRPVGTATTRPAAEAAKIIRAFVKRYEKGKAAADALKAGMQLATAIEDVQLLQSLRDQLLKTFPNDPLSRRILRAMGKGPDVGKPFAAELTKLDGTKLSLPADLKGKVVVVDFWATWCGPCVREIPRMRALYGRYKARGVEFVGISLDRAGQRAQLAQFVKLQQMNWIHTYSGHGWADPTARKYGVEAIPSIWVVGKDGKVFSDNARSNLAETLEKALAAKTTTQPATTQPAAKARP